MSAAKRVAVLKGGPSLERQVSLRSGAHAQEALVRLGYDPRAVRTYEFRWEMNSSPEQLWPYVSNTERLCRRKTLKREQLWEVREARCQAAPEPLP